MNAAGLSRALPLRGKNRDITGTISGLVSLTAPGIAAKDRAELTGGARLPIWNNGAITASVTMSLVHETTYTTPITGIKPMLVYSFRRAGAHGTNVE